MTTLFYAPGACSLSPHIALREAGVQFELERVDLQTKKTQQGDDFLTINPKGYVPALRLQDGQVLTEGAVIVQYVADTHPDARLAPRPGTLERLRLNEWLNFIATELHKTFGVLFNPKSNEEIKRVFRERLESRFRVLESALSKRDFLLGESFSVADGYAYYTLRNLRRLEANALDQSAPLQDFFERVQSRPAVRAALQAEGLQ